MYGSVNNNFSNAGGPPSIGYSGIGINIGSSSILSMAGATSLRIISSNVNYENNG